MCRGGFSYLPVLDTFPHRLCEIVEEIEIVVRREFETGEFMTAKEMRDVTARVCFADLAFAVRVERFQFFQEARFAQIEPACPEHSRGTF